MDGKMRGIVLALSEIEREALKAMRAGEWLSAGEIAESASLNPDSARRALGWLAEKGLLDVDEKHARFVQATPKGADAAKNGVVEKRMLELLQQHGGKAGLDEIGKELNLERAELNIALGIAKRNAWVSIGKGGQGIELELTGLEKDVLGKSYLPEEVLNRALGGTLAEGAMVGKERAIVDDLIKRGLLKWEEKTERKAMLNARGRQALEEAGKINVSGGAAGRAYNINSPVPELFAGKRQPYVQFLNLIRKRMVELGFKEMKERLIVQEFYNFDVLFQPQNHPARMWTDSYTMKEPKSGMLPDKKAVNAVSGAHETGGVSKSRGWGYKWSADIAARLMPNAHGTTADARQIVEGIEIPGKYFVINRCYRPDVVDATHLVEFNQCDGFIVGDDLNFRSLLGMLKQFALEVAGAEKVKFLPDYYPFTEPSVQLSALHPEMGWIEFAGAGMFRPEMMENLGVKQPAIAWGMGIDRLAMFKLGIKDIRYLFSDDINWLRNAPLLGVDA
ncbi:MAG: phenylalanine--tRNA ligase subunit alpha [Candidatus Diapherotrites archaeon]|nr:phenylalanine--tRNA ligase subunit alpha [Candidatus Micrarchaeota archaeon]MBU1939553.1 phenylalanine--tRNA ligase subunit alpha [Candidatus Micrarchaeota archaeon]